MIVVPGSITRREWQLASFIAFVTAIIMQVPYILGYVFARQGSEFTGLLINHEDASYLSVISQGMEGSWQYHSQFTSESHPSAFLYGFYLALGHIAKVFAIANVTIWQLSLFISAIFLFLTVYAFLCIYFPDSYRRMIAYLLAIFGAGFDWSIFAFERVGSDSGLPIDFKMPEAHLFFSALTYPHFSIGIALILITFMLTRRAWSQQSWRLAIFAGFSNLALGIVYPFLMYLVVGVLSTYLLCLSWHERRILWKYAPMLIVSFVIPAPLYGYYQYVLISNPVFMVWNEQAVTASPNIIHYLLTYGALLLLGVLIIVKSFRAGNEFVFLWIWIAVAAILLYAPLNAQRRFVEGLQVPLVITATLGLFDSVLPRIEKTRIFRMLAANPRYSVDGLRQVFLTSFLLVMSTSSVIILIQLSVMTGLQQPDPIFRSILEFEAMDWLRDHTSRDDAILASYRTASYIPARSGNRIFVGQRYETNHFEERLEQSQMFLNGETNDEWRLDLLNRFNVAYVFVGPREQADGSFDPSRANYLKLVFSNSSVRIFSVLLR